MTDEKYMFIQDSKDKKITARSARHTRTHNGKGGSVKFPSDFMSRKELKAMNGPVERYRMNDPMSWDEFKALPDDLKVDYIKAIREKFGAPDTHIAEMFGVSNKTLGIYLTDLKLRLGKGANNRSWDKEKFYAWRSGADENAVEEAAEIKDEPEDDAENVSHNNPTYMIVPREESVIIPTSGTMSLTGNATDVLSVINNLLQNRRVQLTVTWELNSDVCRPIEEASY